MVDFEGVKQLIVVFEGGHIGAYSIGDFNQIHMDSMVRFSYPTTQ